MWIWLISNLTSRQARSLSSSSRRNRTHYWIIKVRIKARSWTEYIYNIYNWPFRTGASSYLTFAVSPVTGYLLDIYWTSSRYSPHKIFFKKFLFDDHFVQLRTWQELGLVSKEVREINSTKSNQEKQKQSKCEPEPCHWQQAVYLNTENIDVACCMFCRKLRD